MSRHIEPSYKLEDMVHSQDLLSTSLEMLSALRRDTPRPRSPLNSYEQKIPVKYTIALCFLLLYYTEYTRRRVRQQPTTRCCPSALVPSI